MSIEITSSYNSPQNIDSSNSSKESPNTSQSTDKAHQVNAVDSVNIQQGETAEKTEKDKKANSEKPWWDPANLAKQAAIIGLNIGGSIIGGAIGFALGGPPGALIGASIAGAGMSGLTSVIEQQLSTGKIDWGQVGIESAIGGIPLGGIGNATVKGMSKLGLGIMKESAEGITAQIVKGSVNGATEGAIQGGMQGSATSIYQQSKEGNIDFGKVTEDTLSGVVGGTIGGGVFGGAMHGLIGSMRKRNENSTNTKQGTNQESILEFNKTHSDMNVSPGNKTPFSEIFIDEYGIPRLLNEKKYPEQMSVHFPEILRNEAFWPFLEIKNDQSQRLLAVENFFKMSTYGINLPEPSIEDLHLYDTVKRKYLSSYQSSPHFVIPQDDGTYIFCIDYRRRQKAIKVNDEFYLLREIPSASSEDIIRKKLEKLSEIKYFPKISIMKDRNSKSFYARQFIPETNSDSQISDFELSEFLNSIKTISFKPDINPTNFVRHQNQIYYIDQDLIYWLNDESNSLNNLNRRKTKLELAGETSSEAKTSTDKRTKEIIDLESSIEQKLEGKILISGNVSNEQQRTILSSLKGNTQKLKADGVVKVIISHGDIKSEFGSGKWTMDGILVADLNQIGEQHAKGLKTCEKVLVIACGEESIRGDGTSGYSFQIDPNTGKIIKQDFELEGGSKNTSAPLMGKDLESEIIATPELVRIIEPSNKLRQMIDALAISSFNSSTGETSTIKGFLEQLEELSTNEKLPTVAKRFIADLLSDSKSFSGDSKRLIEKVRDFIIKNKQVDLRLALESDINNFRTESITLVDDLKSKWQVNGDQLQDILSIIIKQDGAVGEQIANRYRADLLELINADEQIRQRIFTSLAVDGISLQTQSRSLLDNLSNQLAGNNFQQEIFARLKIDAEQSLPKVQELQSSVLQFIGQSPKLRARLVDGLMADLKSGDQDVKAFVESITSSLKWNDEAIADSFLQALRLESKELGLETDTLFKELTQKNSPLAAEIYSLSKKTIFEGVDFLDLEINKIADKIVLASDSDRPRIKALIKKTLQSSSYKFVDNLLQTSVDNGLLLEKNLFKVFNKGQTRQVLENTFSEAISLSDRCKAIYQECLTEGETSKYVRGLQGEFQSQSGELQASFYEALNNTQSKKIFDEFNSLAKFKKDEAEELIKWLNDNSSSADFIRYLEQEFANDQQSIMNIYTLLENGKTRNLFDDALGQVLSSAKEARDILNRLLVESKTRKNLDEYLDSFSGTNKEFNELLKMRFERLLVVGLSEKFRNGDSQKRALLLIECFPGFVKICQNIKSFKGIPPSVIDFLEPLQGNCSETRSVGDAALKIQKAFGIAPSTKFLSAGSLNEAYFLSQEINPQLVLRFLEKGIPIESKEVFIGKLQKEGITIDGLNQERKVLLSIIEDNPDLDLIAKKQSKKFIDGFYDGVIEELDLRIEAENTRALASSAKRFDVANVKQVNDEFSQELVLHLARGIGLDKAIKYLEIYAEKGSQEYFNNPEIKNAMKKCPELANPQKFITDLTFQFGKAVSEQAYRTGILHNDMQPANVFAGGGEKKLITTIDAGNVIRRTSASRIDEAGFVLQLLRKDAQGIAERIIKNADSIPSVAESLELKIITQTESKLSSGVLNELIKKRLSNKIADTLKSKIFDLKIDLQSPEGQILFRDTIQNTCKQAGVFQSVQDTKYYEALGKAVSNTFEQLSNLNEKINNKKIGFEPLAQWDVLIGGLIAARSNPWMLIEEIGKVAWTDTKKVLGLR